MMGDSQTAIDAARRLVEAIPEQAYRDICPSSRTSAPYPIRRWCASDMGRDDRRTGARRAVALRNRLLALCAVGVAFAKLGRVWTRREELVAVEEAKSNPAFEGLIMASFASAEQNLDMAVGILAAPAIASAEGDQDEAITQLEVAVAIEDSLP